MPQVNDPSFPYVPEDHFYYEGYFSDRLFQGATTEIELTVFAEHHDAIVPHFRLTVTNWSRELWSYYESFALVDRSILITSETSLRFCIQTLRVAWAFLEVRQLRFSALMPQAIHGMRTP